LLTPLGEPKNCGDILPLGVNARGGVGVRGGGGVNVKMTMMV